MTSALTLYQAVVIIAGLAGKNLKDLELVKGVLDSIESLQGLRIIPLTLEDLTQAASLMMEYSLGYEDALHLATALRNNAKEIVSNDRDFDKTPLKRKFS